MSKKTGSPITNKGFKKEFKKIDLRFDHLEKRMDELAADGLVTKDQIHKIVIKLIQHDEQFEQIHEKLNNLATKEDIARFFQYAETMLKKGERFDLKASSHGIMLTDLEQKARNHEHRITRLESDSPPTI